MQSENVEAWSTVLMGEVLLFGLLGKALFGEPDKAWLESLIEEDVFSEAPFGADQPEIKSGLECLNRWALENRNGLDEAGIKVLRQDQLLLFIGIDRVLAPMWESVYFNISHLVFQEQTLQVREWYARFGLQSEQLNREPDDQIGLELSFVGHLASLALQAQEEGDTQKMELLLQAQRDFLSQHLLRWGPAWTKLVNEHTQTDFYRGMAHLTHGALLAAAACLEIPMPKEVSL
ncbi:MAG: molecular chaperone TorD family protein [Chloroflexota bacterium]